MNPIQSKSDNMKVMIVALQDNIFESCMERVSISNSWQLHVVSITVIMCKLQIE